ncbi:KinB signaling pathway activation protein [Paenibacillus cellulosilyticus]|uniref:KinB signaling pathway activation protein n=1 Tax=Paenibacillus cellulosilyticus TaxID=375489 RepID=A0A2V2YL78_9BACL|nr:KinB-signaling pathway activation protein [Paenibacillus cellulosilyticus]PWV94368.1 KinB signaling pathway activation protein [Paenibacillus cellulosilyticus]QKS47805.1 KinB-signaling pathway activation protein [Paenibacillus cellulosilyticus]
MNLRKLFFLFWSSMAVGAVTCTVLGLALQFTDQSYGFLKVEETGYNALMMAISGLMIGVFAMMGFFAYLTVNYIALSIFRQKYLWTMLQGYTSLFATFALGYMLYGERERLSNWLYWVLPIALAIGSIIVSYFKAKQTNRSAFVPTIFLMFVVTVLEAWPSINGETNAVSVVFMITPLFVCNAFQIMWLHKLVGTTNQKTDSANVAKSAS